VRRAEARGEGLGGPDLFERHIGSRVRALFNGPEGFAGFAVEDPDEALFTGLGDYITSLPLWRHGEELGAWRCRNPRCRGAPSGKCQRRLPVRALGEKGVAEEVLSGASAP